ncbi:hypothetical protein [Marinicella gelatinilytica]|uniref:hypothetical protein n=1 Tax=Marinicella gelatinilytica TaxID=2996017 RepID=UPI002260EEC7|nr:hypothetical protein [Marinicella gelatinilytica]MCX7545672.1 hypothetical protein [Marinicella gelatinilytica]
MLNLFIVISVILSAWGAGKYIIFSKEEGVDERGKAILSQASHTTMSFLFLAYSILCLIVGFLDVSAEVLKVIIVVTFSLLILINAFSITYLKKHA